MKDENRQDKFKKLKEEGKTLEEIGKENGDLTRQRVGQIIKPTKRSWKTPYWRAYKKHAYHKKINKTFDNCERCQTI